MNKNIFEQLQTALAPHPYLVFKKANGDEILLLLSSIVMATKNDGGIILRLAHGHLLELQPADFEVFSKGLQEGIDFAVERNAQATLQAMLAGGKLPLT